MENYIAGKKVPAEDSLVTNGDPFQLAITLFRHNPIGFSYDYNAYPFYYSARDMLRIKTGTCGDIARFATQLMRSRAIPTAEDVIAAWADRSSNHVWNNLILPNHHNKDLGYNSSGHNPISYRISKIYRKRFSLLRYDSLYTNRKKESVPEYFSNYNLIDVTYQYDMPLSDIHIKNLKPKGTNFAWLCTFDNTKWVPVAYSYIKNKKAIFKNMGRGLMFGDNTRGEIVNDGEGIVYLPVYIKAGILEPASNPIILKTDGSQYEINIDLQKTETIIVKRKYGKFLCYKDNEEFLADSRFEGSNNPDFLNAEVLCTIDTPFANLMQKIEADVQRPFRYLRFVPGDSSVNIAELKIYSDTSIIQASPMADKADYLLDADILTNRWIGSKEDDDMPFAALDLGKKQVVSSIALCPWTDDNEVFLGQEYQLLYWDRGWQLMGTQIAQDYTLTWDNVPKGALLWLRNLTKGKEERIFTYQDGKQIWW